MAAATIMLWVVVLVVAVVVYLTRQNIETSTADADSEATTLEDSEGQTSTKQTIVTEPLEPTSSTETRRPPPVEPSPPETTTTEIPKELGPETLLCTYGRRTTSDAVMASDGLCDYAFYDSLYALGQNKLSTSRPFTTDLQTFIRGASKYKKTSSGVAFAFE
ncbi:hypothetical protein MTO96_017607 [Rhipicephalus appendiculatus]